jgi:hypothetical protein
MSGSRRKVHLKKANLARKLKALGADIKKAKGILERPLEDSGRNLPADGQITPTERRSYVPPSPFELRYSFGMEKSEQDKKDGRQPGTKRKPAYTPPPPDNYLGSGLLFVAISCGQCGAEFREATMECSGCGCSFQEISRETPGIPDSAPQSYISRMDDIKSTIRFAQNEIKLKLALASACDIPDGSPETMVPEVLMIANMIARGVEESPQRDEFAEVAIVSIVELFVDKGIKGYPILVSEYIGLWINAAARILNKSEDKWEGHHLLFDVIRKNMEPEELFRMPACQGSVLRIMIDHIYDVEIGAACLSSVLPEAGHTPSDIPDGLGNYVGEILESGNGEK